MEDVCIETGSELLTRLLPYSPLEQLESKLFSTLAVPSVIEVSGETGSGKTELHYHFITKCIFPSSWKGVPMNGLSSTAIFIDNDHHFNLLRLTTIIEKKTLSMYNNYQAVKEPFSKSDLELHVRNCLASLYVIQCYSSEDLVFTISCLEFQNRAHYSLLIIDSVSAFYWYDRMRVGNTSKYGNDCYGQLVTKLKKLISTHNMILVVSKQAIWNLGDLAASTGKPDFMGRKWKNFVTHFIVLRKLQRYSEVPCDLTRVELQIFSNGNKIEKLLQISKCGIEVL